jgi:ParB-like chromosome segregation protein Spo0J
MEKVFTVTFQFAPKPVKPPKPRPTYRNPIYRAKEYARMIESSHAKNESDLARKLGVSRVTVNHFVRLLKLDASIIRALEQLGDPLTERVITERRLRPYLRKDPKEQKAIIKTVIFHK